MPSDPLHQSTNEDDDAPMVCAVCDKQIAPEETFWIADSPLCRECYDGDFLEAATDA